MGVNIEDSDISLFIFLHFFLYFFQTSLLSAENSIGISVHV